MSRQNLLIDVKGNVIQEFVADPTKSVAPETIVASTLSLASIIDIPETLAVRIYSDAAILRTFNTLNTFTFPINANTPTIVYLDEAVTDVVLQGSATISIEAM